MKKIYFACLSAVLMISACTKNDTEGQLESDIVQSAPMLASTFTEPKDWARSENDGAISFTAPEGDLSLAVVPIENAPDAKTAASLAWQALGKSIDREVSLMTERAASRGWEAIWSIEYETSPAEERVLHAFAHDDDGIWTVMLIDGNLGTIGKRGAAASTVLQSLSAAGHQSEDLSERTAKDFTPEMLAEFLAFVESSAQALQLPGVGIGLIQNGEVIYSGGVGVKDSVSNAAIDGDTRFMIASNTKGMTTLLLAKLVELGKVNWDDQVIAHYPDFRLGDDDTTSSVLIRHLVCACTGLPRKDLEWVFNNAPDTPATSVFVELAATQPTSGFGEIYQYNNQMAAAAGYVAAHIFYPDMEVGAAYDLAMQEYIFDPLGMSNTTFDFTTAINGNVAKPYTTNFDAMVIDLQQTASKGFNHTGTAIRPAGAAWSTPSDMLKYIKNELNAGLAADGKRLFAQGPLLERRVPTVEAGAGETYGMGLSNIDMNGIAVVEHGGSMGGYKSQMVIIPSANVGAVILTNSDMGGYLLSPFGQKIIELLYDAQEKAEATIAASAKSLQERLEKERAELTIPADPAIVSGLAKTYVGKELGAIEIIANDNAVILDTGVWSAPLGTKINQDGSTSLVVVGDATQGIIEMVVGESEGKRTLSLITPQHRYVLFEVD
jgi:CubicO group peptidase (beta-lactamase class C family)